MCKIVPLKVLFPETIILMMCLSFSCGRGVLENGRAGKALEIEVKTDQFRAQPGESVKVWAVVRSARSLRRLQIDASLFVPTKGVEDLALRVVEPKGKKQIVYQGQIPLGRGFPEGVYGITVKASLGPAKAIGKGCFLLGKAVGDFLIVSSLPEEDQENDLRRYFEDFRGIGGNMVVIHDIISEKAWYPSRVCAKPAAAGSPEDKVGRTLSLAQEYGFSCLLSAAWDMTQTMPYAKHMESIEAAIGELWELYGSSPALLGFYDYQEGSGTYLVSHIREFARAVKEQNRGLLAACAPYIDDPLLAGYLAAIDDLDMVIYQGAVMASFRPDNRKCFPLRRTKDCTALSAGATLQKNKITLSHVELFGYLEKSFANSYLAGPDDIRGQMLSAATCHGPDGIILFSYHYNIHEMGKTIPEVKESRRGVQEGIAGYQIISHSAASVSSHLGLYIPYSDWWVDRWTNCVLPALDAFRRLGMSPDIIPFIPPKGEEVLPYYPYHLNEEQLEYLLSRQHVLVLADIAGMQDTDSLLLKEFVEKGGVVFLFGPHIPYGDLFDREDLCGGKENPALMHSWIEIRESFWMRTMKNDRFRFPPAFFTSWSPTQGNASAAFEDGSAAVLRKKSRLGYAVTIPLSLREAVEIMPDFLRDLLDVALGFRGVMRPFDLLDGNEETDVAMAFTQAGRVLAVVNHREAPWPLRIRPRLLKEFKTYRLTDLRTGRLLAEHRGKDRPEIRISIPGKNYSVLSLSEK